MPRLAWIGFAGPLLASVLLASPMPAAARPSMPHPTASRGVSYGHALRVEAQREAFWRAHARGRSPTDRVELDRVAARRADYPAAQLRGRVLCEDYGGCL